MPEPEPVDNSLDLLPREENLARLYELTSRLGLGTAATLHGPHTAQREHLLETGHLLRFGCCRDAENASQR